MIEVRIAPEAVDDLNVGFWFYEAQEIGLGDYFSSCIRGDIEGLKVSGGVHRMLKRNYRRILSRVFPYAIYYTYSDDTVVVWAVIDCRRNPDWINAHLGTLS